ncbi:MULTISPECIES: type II toxin-antitoxin system RelE/ParE family toxin [unclassified Mycobacterium]|uniref:type II toxin-antitoxin system RelE family toxin n=1 Tax=unclassified Mycobacterium TaxID=2642494 RepID=UPI00096F0B7D|nr:MULTISPECIES: type II toxin-antitoxin system RelE/ParE family toxin [unclassified Mycobacterium]
MTYRVELTRRARRSLSEELPEVVAAACWEFICGPLAEHPHRVGKRLRDELAGRWSARRGDFRVVYEIHEDVVVVRVIDVRHRRDVYR